MGEKRITPEEALKAYKKQNRGVLKIFLGYAPGVGKTYTMLNEANRRFERGKDVVVGYFESHDRANTINQLKNLPCIPLKEITYNSIILKEMDVDAIIERKPNLVLVDELAHTNAPGSKNKKRYEDVLEILDAGINVYSTINLQHLESLNDIVKQITGVNVNETIPDKIIAEAEVVVIDMPPEGLRNRLKRGNIYKPYLVESALKNFFRNGNLSALRELTLRQIADEVDEDLEKYKSNHDINDNWYTAERVMVSISSNPKSKRLIRLGARIAKKYKCPFYVVYVNCTHLLSSKETPQRINGLKENILLAEKFNATVVQLTGKSVSNELLKFSHEKHITQLIIGHPKRNKIQRLFRGSTINKFLEHAKDIQVIVVPYDSL
ncbi:universal stress protein [Clostridium uliginosum]|uniref:Two-component system, OmpR family, sensor histidine kinase KdpD n=1 Tax=Clostridium uliginosum TaxID=119641 RepID=A0A1I1KTW1_9CLOT|nr:universal stress protein [Clostridium uliginosum]SFC64161.1 two-component system, OmpR family, sensor histidine kinase KdpD [Clostridium uliginosum]